MLPIAPAGRAFDVVGLGAASLDLVYVVSSASGVLRGARRDTRDGATAPSETTAAAATPTVPASSPDKFRIHRHFVSPGGQVATALATCARLGLRARFAGVLGSDDHADLVRHALVERGVDVTSAIVHDAPNQYAVIVIERANGERTVLWDRDERLILREQELASEIVATARVAHLDDVDVDAAVRIADLARAAGTLTTTDIDQATERTLALISAVTIPILAEHVASALTGINDTGEALRALRRHHAGVLCATLGARGALALDGDLLVHAPACTVQAVDTTGAGDVFRGAFIYALLKERPLEEVLRLANAAAAVSCTREGAMPSVPTLEDTERMLRTEHGIASVR